MMERRPGGQLRLLAAVNPPLLIGDLTRLSSMLPDSVIAESQQESVRPRTTAAAGYSDAAASGRILHTLLSP